MTVPAICIPKSIHQILLVKQITAVVWGQIQGSSLFVCHFFHQLVIDVDAKIIIKLLIMVDKNYKNGWII